MTDSFKICKKCGLIQEPTPHVAPWEEPCLNCGEENYDFIKELDQTPERIRPSICPKCHHRSVGEFITGEPDIVSQYLKEIADGTMRAGEYEYPDIEGIAKDWYCMDCDFKWSSSLKEPSSDEEPSLDESTLNVSTLDDDQN